MSAKIRYWVSDNAGGEHGPVSAGEVRKLISAGKVTASTLVKRSDQEHWSTAGSFAEFRLKDRSEIRQKATATDALGAEIEKTQLTSLVTQRARWFYCIALFTLGSALLSYYHLNYSTGIGLGLCDSIGDFAE